MVTGIEHTAIASPDPLKLAQWYVDHLGFVINYKPPVTKTVFIRAPDRSMLEIIEASAPLPGVSAMRDPGLRHIAITVSDFDAVHQRLLSEGVHFLNTPEMIAGNRLVFFTDGDGNILHLLHRETPLP